MYEINLANLVFSGLVTWGIGLAPPLVIRYAILKAPMGKWPAIGVCLFFWLFNVMLFSILGSQSKTHTALTLVMFVSYWILRKKSTPSEQARNRAVINDSSGDGTTPLMGAAMLGKMKQLRELVAAGANVDAADERGWTALMYAADRNEVGAVEFLLEQGASATLRNNANQTAAEIADMKGNDEVAEVFKKREDGRAPEMAVQPID